MTKAKAKRMAVRLEELAGFRAIWISRDLAAVTYTRAALRDERDFFLTLAADLRLLSEGKRLPRKKVR